MPEEKMRHDWTASVLILRSDRRVLLLFHEKLGVWLGPGGHVEPGETPDQAALREVREETGLAVTLVGPRDPSLDDARSGVECLRSPYVILKEKIHDSRDPHIHLDLIYCARLPAGAPETEAVISGEHGARFVPEGELAALPMFPNYRALLARVFADQPLWARLQADHAADTTPEARCVDAPLQA